MTDKPDVIIIGAGIAGLTLALELHRVGIGCRVYEAAPELEALGVGINILPHASRVLCRLGLEAELNGAGVLTAESVFYNRFGQFVYAEPAGTRAGYDWPQYSIHRGDLQRVLAAAVVDRLGGGAIVCDHRCAAAWNSAGGASARFVRGDGRNTVVSGQVVVACDGVHSTVRGQLHPGEGPPVYSGVNMWRGVAMWPPFLSGASMVRAGWLETGKLVVYPIRNQADAVGNQLVNWVAEITTPRHQDREWTQEGRLGDFLPAFADWRFDWLDVPALIQSSGRVLEYPMVDQDPLPWWTSGRITLLGDAAHPMVPRGSNGAGQAILDATTLAETLSAAKDPRKGLAAYEKKRRPATAKVVQANRTNPPDAILREVFERTGDRPFERIEDVISEAEMRKMTDSYKNIAGYSPEALARS
jgi:2-polyprenyl-6-methoxyphenol hydroxylase-like FAD-dependent oxidoreductase